MDISKMLLKVAEVTKGRVDRRTVFGDFLESCACTLSNRTDPIHLEARKECVDYIAKKYTEQERILFDDAFRQLTSKIVQNVNCGIYADILGPVYCELNPTGGSLKQDFTPSCIGSLLSRICHQDDVLPERGYFTMMEPSCGSGILCLEYAQMLFEQGFNPCNQVVIQAADLDKRRVHMTYIQLAFYGIPAVIVRGDSLLLKEYDRWYTPVYIWNNWIWREPLPFGSGRNKSDELQKMASEPWYATARMLESYFKST